ncbi:hypothetical protein ScPMuIL_000354 [Solemya velum]
MTTGSGHRPLNTTEKIVTITPPHRSDSATNDAPVVSWHRECGDCPRGSAYNADLCFEIFATDTTWEGANDECQSYGGRLAKISDSDIHNFLSSMILASTGGGYRDYWIGALVHKVWNWGGGNQLQYEDWFTDEPNNLQRGEDRIMLWQATFYFLSHLGLHQNCFIAYMYGQYDDGAVEAVSGGYKWIDEDPTRKETHGVISKYICQFDDTLCSAISHLCGGGVCTDHGGHCFLFSGPLEDKFTSLAYSWAEADTACQNSGGKLAWVEDSATAEAVINKINTDSNLIGNYWTGATLDLTATINNWYWTDGTPVTLINTLDPDFPQSEFCMVLTYTENKATNDYQWLNVDCSSSQSFVCEYDPARGRITGLQHVTNYTVGSVVTYACDEGYHTYDVISATCNSTGNWSHGIPECSSIKRTISLETLTIVVTVLAAGFCLSGFVIGYCYWTSGHMVWFVVHISISRHMVWFVVHISISKHMVWSVVHITISRHMVWSVVHITISRHMAWSVVHIIHISISRHMVWFVVHISISRHMVWFVVHISISTHMAWSVVHISISRHMTWSVVHISISRHMTWSVVHISISRHMVWFVVHISISRHMAWFVVHISISRHMVLFVVHITISRHMVVHISISRHRFWSVVHISISRHMTWFVVHISISRHMVWSVVHISISRHMVWFVVHISISRHMYNISISRHMAWSVVHISISRHMVWFVVHISISDIWFVHISISRHMVWSVVHISISRHMVWFVVHISISRHMAWSVVHISISRHMVWFVVHISISRHMVWFVVHISISRHMAWSVVHISISRHMTWSVVHISISRHMAWSVVHISISRHMVWSVVHISISRHMVWFVVHHYI